MDLVGPVVELYRRMSCELPADVTAALRTAREREEKDSLAQEALDVILENVKLSLETSRPLCQDTGLPAFYVGRPAQTSERKIREAILEATRDATELGYLRANAVDPVTAKNSGDNTGIEFPIVHFHETDGPDTVIDAMLKGGGCENAGMRYKLPDDGLGAGRDLEGVRRCVLDAVHHAQGLACPPYIIAVAIGGARDATAELAKRQLLRKIGDHSHVEALAGLEARLADEANALGIGPAGLGGKTTVLAVKAAAQHRPLASYFVEVSFGCWAMRRGSVVIGEKGVRHG